MALLGSDFNPSNPTDSSAASSLGNVIRDIKLRLKSWVSVEHDPDTGKHVAGSIVNSYLADMSGLTPGTYTKVSVNSKGRVTSGSTPTKLADYGITDALSSDETVETANGGTGIDASSASTGSVFIMKSDGTFQCIPLTAGDGITITNSDSGISIAASTATLTPFAVRATLTSAAAATAVTLITDATVPSGKKCYISSFLIKVNGATAWATTSTVSITDNADVPVTFVRAAVAGLKGNALLFPSSSNLTLGSAFYLSSGGTSGKGLKIIGDANGTGSDIVVTVTGYYAS